MIGNDLKLAIYKRIMNSLNSPLSPSNIDKLLEFVESSISLLQCNLPGAEGLDSSRASNMYIQPNPFPIPFAYIKRTIRSIVRKEPSDIETSLAKELRPALASIMESPFGLKTLMKMKRMLSASSRLANASNELASSKGTDSIDESKFIVEDAASSDEAEEEGSGRPYSISSTQENFGAKMLREILAMVPMLVKMQHEPKMSPVELIQAIVVAETNGLDDLAAQLKMKMGLESVPSVASTVTEPATTVSESTTTNPALEPA